MQNTLKNTKNTPPKSVVVTVCFQSQNELEPHASHLLKISKLFFNLQLDSNVERVYSPPPVYAQVNKNKKNKNEQ